MANQYYKNFILWGEVDFYCLICEETFHDLAELDRHIRWENHRKVLKAQAKCHKFKKEVIYKVGELYYCEFCNFVTADISTDAMNLHIESEEHKTNKKKPKSDAEITSNGCKREGEYIIVGDVIVEEKDWNCVTHIENYCLVCGVYLLPIYAFVLEHIKAPRHLINLIATKVFVDNDRMYRKLCSNYFYCLCCKEALPTSVFEGHWTEKEHVDFRNDCIFKTTYANANAAKAIEGKKIQIERGLILKHLKDYYVIFEDKESAICNQCHRVVKLEFKTMNDHKKSHNDVNNVDKNDKPEPDSVISTGETVDSSSEEDTYKVIFCELTDHGQRRRDLAKYGKTNFIKLNSGGSKGYCNLCCTTISGHLKLFKEHVRGARHRGHLELQGIKKSKVHKLPDEKFKMIHEIVNNVYFSEELKMLCLNREICIDVHSFILVYEIDKRFQYKATKCLLCDELYPYSYDFDHYGTDKHKKRFLSAKVMAKDGEFVREIRPDVYHCGICNKIYPFWELMEKHLLSKPHIDSKNVNKYKVFEQKTFDETQLKISSKNPDIFYLQLLTIGIIKSKSVLLSVKDMQISGSFQIWNAKQDKNACIHQMNATQVPHNADVQSVNAKTVTSDGIKSVTQQDPKINAVVQSVNGMQDTNASHSK